MTCYRSGYLTRLYHHVFWCRVRKILETCTFIIVLHTQLVLVETVCNLRRTCFSGFCFGIVEYIHLRFWRCQDSHRFLEAWNDSCHVVNIAWRTLANLSFAILLLSGVSVLIFCKSSMLGFWMSNVIEQRFSISAWRLLSVSNRHACLFFLAWEVAFLLFHLGQHFFWNELFHNCWLVN